MKSPAGYFLYLFGKFGTGLASLPEGGMQDLALQLAEKLKKDVVFGFKAISVSENEIVFDNKEHLTFDHVILATDMSSLMKLGVSTSDKWNSVTTSYFKTKSKW